MVRVYKISRILAEREISEHLCTANIYNFAAHRFRS